MRQVWAEQSRPGAQFSTHVFPVASEECALVKIETQGLFSNIQRFSALLLIPLASLAAREDWSKHKFADKEGNDDFRVFSQIRLGQCRLYHHGTISPQRARHQVGA